jgi:hypothetical protein
MMCKRTKNTNHTMSVSLNCYNYNLVHKKRSQQPSEHVKTTEDPKVSIRIPTSSSNAKNLASSCHDFIRACSLQDATHNVQDLHRVTHTYLCQKITTIQASLNPDAPNSSIQQQQKFKKKFKKIVLRKNL